MKKRPVKNRKIYILLTRLPDQASKWIGFMSHSYYSHASIGLEENQDTFYSFVHSGFRVEKLSWYRSHGKNFPCQVYELDVTEKTYDRIKSLIMFFVTRREQFQYNAMGAVMCCLHMPYKKRRNYYFCSQFVAEVLKEAKALRVRKQTNRMRPGDFAHLKELKLLYHGRLLNYGMH